MSAYGIGFRPTHYSEIIAKKPKLDFVEIISENFMAVGGNPKRKLEEVRKIYPIAMHGVSLSIGSYDPLDMKYIGELKRLSDFIEPFVVSDHICFTKDMNGRNFHDLLPIAYNQHTLEHLVSRIHVVQDMLGRALLFENPSAYLAWTASDMTEVDFLIELCKRTGAGLLLDLNNLIVNQNNLLIPPSEYLEKLGPQVRQFHIAGHKVYDGIRIDTHDEPVSDEVWKLWALAKKKWPDVPVLLEWDDHIPPLDTLLEEIDRARDVKSFGEKETFNFPIIQKVDPLVLSSKKKSPVPKSSPSNVTGALTQSILNSTPLGIAALSESFRIDLPTTAPLGMETYRFAYFERIEAALKETFKCLYYIAEDAGFRAITNHYLRYRTSQHWSLNLIGNELASVLRTFELNFDFGVPQALMADIADLDQLSSEVFLAPDSQILFSHTLKSLSPEDLETLVVEKAESIKHFQSKWDLVPLIECVNRGETPNIPEEIETLVLISRRNAMPSYSRLTKSQAALLFKMSYPQKLSDLLEEDIAESLRDFAILCEREAIAYLS